GNLAHQLLQRAAQGSLYALEQELQHGFLTLPGGHRLGLAGQVIAHDGGYRLVHVGSVNVRLARAQPGAGLFLLEALAARRLLPPFPSLLLAGPPGSGKTTLLRDLIRLASEGVAAHGLEGLRVGVVDERSELAACHHGVPRHWLGPRTDVLDGAPKVAGLMQLIRTMDPQVGATDEIGSSEDAWAVLEARKAGVIVLATAHAGSLEELAARPGLGPLLAQQAFDAVCLLARRPRPGQIAAVLPCPHNPRRGEAVGARRWADRRPDPRCWPSWARVSPSSPPPGPVKPWPGPWPAGSGSWRAWSTACSSWRGRSGRGGRPCPRRAGRWPPWWAP